VSEDTEEGALGIVVNRVIPSLTVGSIFRELNIDYTASTAKIPLHIGGPVHENEIFVLHGQPFFWEGCLMITPTLAMSNTMDIIKAIAKGQGPKAFLIALGCAGWGRGQLATEILQNVWLTCPVDDKIIFEYGIDERWHAAVKLLGIDPLLLSDTPGHA
jgi:putative transcriptional regulator